MKAEAPEKLYIALNELTEDGRTFVLDHHVDYPICTEYIRKDTFIEKAVRYLNSKLYDWVQTTNPNQRSYANTIIKQDFIEDFKNYMKGE